MKTFEGSIVALATPFRGGALDEEAYRGFIRFQLENGTQGLVPIGTTGEAVTMSAEERFRAVKIAVEIGRGKVPVIAGAGTNSTQETIEGVKRVREAGADAALVVTPYYNKPTQTGLLEHYRAIAKAHPGFPIVAYNVPGRTGVDLLPETCQRLCDLPEVVAIKEATASMVRAVDIVERCGDRLTLLTGDDFTVLPFIACGGKGVISVSANVAPRMMADLVKAARTGNLARAAELQVKLNPLHRLLFVESNPIPVKWALHLMNRFGPEIRLPLTPISESNGAKLKDELRKLALI
ncbi:MAG TPA: 4-hydroxy-tetrahydrodipicolinate synthase [Myxococcaceae bacterium]|nr:4-hydroxy-tetrahydrodipicolinate synthase [Myxococcaceae bacterium]